MEENPLIYATGTLRQPSFTDIPIRQSSRTTLAILAPFYSAVRDTALEVLRHVTLSTISHHYQHLHFDDQEDHQQDVMVLTRRFFSPDVSPQQICSKLGRANTRGIILLVRHSSWFSMCDQIDMSLSRLWNSITKAPSLPLCILVHGDHKAKVFYRGKSVDQSKKNLLQAALGKYLIEHTAVPAIMFAAHLVQIRQCFTDFLLKDKARSLLKWILAEMDRTPINYKTRWGYQNLTRLPQNELSRAPTVSDDVRIRKVISRKSLAKKFISRRSHSEPRLTPVPTSRGYSSKIIISVARQSVLTSLDICALEALLHKISARLFYPVSNEEDDSDIHDIIISTDRHDLTQRASYILSIFRRLKSYQEGTYSVLEEQLQSLNPLVHDLDPHHMHSFSSHITWASQPWSRTVTHISMKFEVGKLHRQQIFHLPIALTYEELRVLRAFYLDYYAAQCPSIGKHNGNRKRAYSVGPSGYRHRWTGSAVKSLPLRDKEAFLFGLIGPANPADWRTSRSEAAVTGTCGRQQVAWKTGDGRVILVPKACLHPRRKRSPTKR
ncbi:hypothetical protein RvY_13471 [Ramazzottius varieornatus]|uniref:Uncharacterized protein n=1 Tax=Ramazzottius varieornatus TaxID=947166 RepID=A0A1D1VQ57_RAMVA|nr:hypothetical protein RvY_13471 [Ramazzottius varieornatus]